MKKLYPLLSVLFLIYWGCEEEQPEEVDTTPPTVTITSPQNGSTVSDSITITCISSDDEGVEKVELWVNGVTTGVSEDTEPYSFVWITMTLEEWFIYDNSSFISHLRGNTTDSEPIILTVQNTPTEVTLWGVVYSVEETDSLNLYNNDLTGSIPLEIGNLNNLNKLNVRLVMNLTGEIPSEIGNLTNLSYFEFMGQSTHRFYPIRDR